MKVLLVSDVHHFSVIDIYNGYVEAFNKLGIDFDIVELHTLTNLSSVVTLTGDGAFGLMLAKALNKENNFTHVIFVSGLSIPAWVWKSLYDKKIGVIALDDPHATKHLLQYKDNIHYYFTNEKTVAGYEKNFFYLPTATSSRLPSVGKEEVDKSMWSDVCFIGTIYKDRVPVLEQACEYCEENGKVIKIAGNILNTPKNSIIRKYFVRSIISNDETKMFYRGANLVLNIDREVNWNPNEEEGNTLLLDRGTPYSMNPRAYEIAGCRSSQLYVNPRQEVFDVFGDNVYTCGYNDVKEALDKFFKEEEYTKLLKIGNCFKIIKEKHCYYHRAIDLINTIKEVDKRELLDVLKIY